MGKFDIWGNLESQLAFNEEWRKLLDNPSQPGPVYDDSVRVKTLIADVGTI